MFNTQAMFSSKETEWATPQDLFDELDEVFHFTLDPCATSKNAKCSRFFTEVENGLEQDWSNSVVFMNPPYGRQIKHWVKKAYDESQKGSTVVCLLPARTDTAWFQDYCLNADDLFFLRGRLKFGDSENSAPFPSVIVIFRGKSKKISIGAQLSKLWAAVGLCKKENKNV